MKEPLYLVRKNPSAVDHVEWLTINSKEEFMSFVHSPEGAGRYFIHLTDDVSYEAQEIYIEAPKEEYLAWKKEYDAHLYLRAYERKAENSVSLYKPVSEEGELLLDRIAAGAALPESVLEAKDAIERLRRVISELPEEDQQLLFLLYLNDKSMTVRQAADKLGLSKSSLQRQKESLFTKISQLFSDFLRDK